MLNVKIMKRLLFVLFPFAVTAFAGTSLSPEGVVSAAISAAHKDQLSLFIRCVDLPAIASQPQHPISPGDVLKLFEKIDEKDVKLNTIAPSSQNGNTVVRMIKPVALDFEIRETIEPNNILYVIVAIHS
jgi:hypothetical protein